MLFYLSMAGEAEQPGFVSWAEQETAGRPPHVGRCLAPALAGLAHVVAGGSFGADGSVVGGASLVGGASVGRAATVVGGATVARGTSAAAGGGGTAGLTPRQFLGWVVGKHWMLAGG